MKLLVLCVNGVVVDSWDLTDGMRFSELRGLMESHIPRYRGLPNYTAIHSIYTIIHSPTILTHTHRNKSYIHEVLGPNKINIVTYISSVCEHFSQVSLTGT